MIKEIDILEDLEKPFEVGTYRGIAFKIDNDVFDNFDDIRRNAIYRIMQEVVISILCKHMIHEIIYDQLLCEYINPTSYGIKLHNAPPETIPKIRYI